ncbi:MAG: MMPL family transporter [Deltaproteobacteria bacterium]|nr:MMPL family transporter [Deltaproteobacteria bacterium]
MGILWLFELMGAFGIHFNLANFFGIPILIGVGIDNAVQIVHRYINERGKQSVSFFMTRSTGIAVLLTSLTTLASFGTLAFARHKGIASLGLIMSIGTITCFITSMIILPCMLKVFGTKEA